MLLISFYIARVNYNNCQVAWWDFVLVVLCHFALLIYTKIEIMANKYTSLANEVYKL